MSDNNTENNNNGCASGCFLIFAGGVAGLTFGIPMGLVAGGIAMDRSVKRHEKRCEINPNCNEIIAFSRTVNAGSSAFLSVTILSIIIFTMTMWFIFKEDKKR